MNRSDKDDALGSPEAAELWRRARPERRDGPEAPDPLLIAAYVDGKLDPQARDQVEAWMASSPDALDLVIAARAAHTDTPLAGAPAGLLTRARGLVRPAVVDTDAKRTIGDWFADMTRPGVWAATAAAMLFAAVVSFELGREATVNLAATETLTVASADDDELAFDPSSIDLL